MSNDCGAGCQQNGHTSNEVENAFNALTMLLLVQYPLSKNKIKTA